MSSNKEREKNIKKQEKILGQSIQHFEAIVGKDYMNKANELNQDIIDDWKHTEGELGCYLSHLMLIKQIADQSKTGYSVIFEDDFKIEVSNLNEKIKDYIKNLEKDQRDFDTIFLGRCSQHKGEEYKDDLREIKYFNDGIVIMCAHGYIIKNSNARKIYESLLHLDDVVDHKFNTNIKNEILKSYLIDPPIVNQQNNILPSTIGH
jgi:GR25 family glycosyltransferase involved in LPS biosynthesis